MTAKQLEDARRGLYDAGVIGDLLQKIGNSEISGGGNIEGTAIAWLGEKLEEALEVVEVALNDVRLRATA